MEEAPSRLPFYFLRQRSPHLKWPSEIPYFSTVKRQFAFTALGRHADKATPLG
jgi:hypothetical protein